MGETVLIITEDGQARRAAETLLRAAGLAVLLARDAAAACDILTCEGAAIVVLDLTFPQTKGFEVLRRLRGRFETRVPLAQPGVIVLSDWTESAVERLAVGLGADAFLRKPVAARELLATVQQLMRGGSSARPAAPAADAADAAWL